LDNRASAPDLKFYPTTSACRRVRDSIPQPSDHERNELARLANQPLMVSS